MKKIRTVGSIAIMIIAGIIGFFVGASMDEALNGAILFSLIAGIACIIYVIDNQEQ
jgi:inner membrane protein involved in colicin E2 resistance